MSQSPDHSPRRRWRFLARCVGFSWGRVPEKWLSSRAFRWVGRLIYDHVSRFDQRHQSHSTWFLRYTLHNRVWYTPLLAQSNGAPVRIASIGCSTGAELYSALYQIRSARPGIRVIGTGVDMSPAVVDVAADAWYDAAGPSSEGLDALPSGAWELGHLSDRERETLFEPGGNGRVRVRDWIRADTHWVAADASDPGLVDRMEPQDVVLANNFLGPMDQEVAEACLRNLVRLVRPGGYLVVDGIDQDLRARLFPTLGLTPIVDRLEEVYYEDPTKRNWPWERWALEPLDFDRPDWRFRYCSIYRKDRAPDGLTPASPHAAGMRARRRAQRAERAIDPCFP